MLYDHRNELNGVVLTRLVRPIERSGRTIVIRKAKHTLRMSVETILMYHIHSLIATAGAGYPFLIYNYYNTIML